MNTTAYCNSSGIIRALDRHCDFQNLWKDPLYKKKFFTLSVPKKALYGKNVDVMAYCLMPTHVHFVLKERQPQGIQKFISQTFNAYTRYFNLRHNRRGPLWEHRYGNTPIKNDDHLIKAIDYVLTNPVKDNLVQFPSEWKYSSYNHPHPRGEGGS
jgi:REP element-mobilizing transposase RayT